VEAEASVAEFAEKNPEVAVTVLRFANVLGPSIRTSHVNLFSLPAVPMILGFDPRYQFVHEDEVVHALEHAVTREAPGVYNVAGDGVLALSEVAGLLGKPYAPILPPWGTGLAAAALRRVGVRIPPEAMNQLRFGRGLDNRRYKVAGFHYQHTSRETVLKLGEHLRLSPVVRGANEPYRYEREVEEFLRWSPHVRNSRGSRGHALSRDQLVELERLLVSVEAGADLEVEAEERERRQVLVEEQAEAARREAAEAIGRAAQAERRAEALEQARAAERRAATERARAAALAAAEAPIEAEPVTAPPAEAPAPVEHYDDLAAEEVIALLGSLEADDLAALREHEREHARRDGVLAAIDSVLERAGGSVGAGASGAAQGSDPPPGP